METIIKAGKYDYLLRCYEKDLNFNLKAVSVLNFMQDAATLNADENGFGTEYVRSNNLAWYILKYKVIFYRHFDNMDKITVKTASRGISKLFAHRDFEFYCNNELFARATSLWALIDFETKKMVKAQDYLSIIGNYEKKEDDLEFEKFPTDLIWQKEKEFRIRYDDFDINQHVNNTNYMIWALETLDFDFRKNNKIKSIDVNYKKSLGKEGKILSKLYFDEQTKSSTHAIYNQETGEEVCALKISWL